MYNTERLWFADDVRKVRGWDIPKADLWTFGFPCQDVSIAGKQKGIKRGTRSGLFYEIMRLIDEAEENRPEWLICENVKNLLSIDGGRGFFEVLTEMGGRGHTVEWKVYNSKDYGVPQNRERVYIVGRYGDSSEQPLLPIRRESTAALGQIISGSQGERVYDANRISCTLSSQGGGLGAKTGLCSFVDLNRKGRVQTTDTARALLARYNKGQPNRTAECSGVLEPDVPIRIRRLTPRECFKLQGFTDEQFDRAAAVNSETQLYKQAGNAVTVNVVEEIGRHILEQIEFAGEKLSSSLKQLEKLKLAEINQIGRTQWHT